MNQNTITITYKNTVHKTVKMKPTGVSDDSYGECNEYFNKTDPKFKVGVNSCQTFKI